MHDDSWTSVDLVKKEIRRTNLQNIILSILGIVFFIVLWTLVVKFEVIDNKLIVTPATVIKTVFNKFTNRQPDGGLLQEHILASLQVSLSGFILAIAIGIPLGLLMGWYKPIDKFLRPIFEVLRPIPPIAWQPVMIVLLGIGLVSKIVIIFLAAFIPSVINSYSGIKLTNNTYINVGTTFGASNFHNFIHIGIPSAAPMIFAGIKLSLGSSWTTLVAAEMLASTTGLGYFIVMGRTFARVDVIMAGMVVIGIIGVLLTWIVERLERSMLKWREV